MDPAVRAAMNITIDAETKKAIEEITGITLTGGADFKGMIFAYVTDNKDKEAEIRQLRATLATMRNRPSVLKGGGDMPPGTILLQIPEWSTGGIAGYAEDCHQSIQEWCQDNFSAWIEQYLSQAPQRT
jgi:hypothetical protein